MADTMGLMKTRKEWTDAVAAGETDLPHAEWYNQKYGPKKQAIEPQMEKPSLAKLSLGQT